MRASRRDLHEDDKQGVTQLYGPYTGFDGGRAQGLENYSTYQARVSGYWSGLPPELGPVGSEHGVQPHWGNRMARLAGRADSGLSYVYFKLFSIDEDTGSEDHGTTLPPGARLKWCQYNYEQATMSLDAHLSDGTSLRSYPDIVDQFGERIGAEHRRGAMREWQCYDIELAPVVGKTVLHWYVSYDNRQTRERGPFRAYFDSIKLVWPGSKP